MKKRLFAILTLTLMVLTVSAQRVVAFVTDSDPFTNLRDAPKGKVIGKIDNKLRQGSHHLLVLERTDAAPDRRPGRLGESEDQRREAFGMDRDGLDMC